jgi:prepilin-type processing-associated H-X9-DG protein
MGSPFTGATAADGPSAVPLSVLVCPSDALPAPPTTYFALTDVYVGLTSYLGNLGSTTSGGNGLFDGSGKTVSIQSVLDGTSNTFLFGERYSTDPNWPPCIAAQSAPLTGTPFYGMHSWWGAWGTPGPLAPGLYSLNFALPPCSGGSNCTAANRNSKISSFGSGHTGGANFVLGDGSVRFVGNAINNNAGLLNFLCTRNGGEPLDGSGY